MKNILLVLAMSLVFGCASEDKKVEPAKDAKVGATKAAATPTKKTAAGTGFADEDISKLKPGQAGAGEESSV